MLRWERLIIGILIVAVFISFASSIPIQDKIHLTMKFTDVNNNIEYGYANYQFIISQNESCTEGVYFHNASITSDARGIVSYYLPNITFDFKNQSWLCVWRNDVFREAVEIVRNPSAFNVKTINIDDVIGIQAFNESALISSVNTTLKSEIDNKANISQLSSGISGTANVISKFNSTGNGLVNSTIYENSTDIMIG